MKQPERIARALANPVYFHVAYIAPFDPNWPTVDGTAVVDGGVPVDMPDFGQDMLRHVWTHDRALVMLPPEFLKTTLLSQTLPLWLTYRSRYFGTQLRGLLMSEEEDMAKANLGVVKWHIENNHLLLRDFSDERGVPIVRPSSSERRWADDAIIVERDHPTRDPTWQAKGLDSKGTHGRRLDWFIGDDLVTPASADSPAKRKAALNVFDRQIRSRLVRDAHAVVAGNFNDLSDLLNTLAKRKRWVLFSRPSLHVPGHPNKAPKESQLKQAERELDAGQPVTMVAPTWPGNWDVARCLDDYNEAPNAFKRLHLFDPRAEHGERLNTTWVTRVPAADVEQLLEASKLWMTIDPAPGGETDDLDFMNVTVGALHRQHLYVVRSISIRAPTPQQVELVGTLHDVFNRMGGGIHAIGGAKQHLDAYFRAALVAPGARPDLAPKLVELSVGTHLNAKELRIEGLGPLARTGYLVITDEVWTGKTSDPVDQHQELTFEDEWREFPHGRHDDRLDNCHLLTKLVADFGMVGEHTWVMSTVDA